MTYPPIVPKILDSVILKEIDNYCSFINEQILKYGNSIPLSSRSEYAQEIAKEFNDWYNYNHSIQIIESVKNTLIFTTSIIKIR